MHDKHATVVGSGKGNKYALQRASLLVRGAVTREFVQPPLSRSPALDNEGLEVLSVINAMPVVAARVALGFGGAARRHTARARASSSRWQLCKPLETQEDEPRAGGRVGVCGQAKPVALRPPDCMCARSGVVANGVGVGAGGGTSDALSACGSVHGGQCA